MLLLLLHHIAGDGWSLAPLARDLARAYAARCRGRRPTCRRCRCSMPTTRCGSTRCWARRAIRESAIARQLAFWTRDARRAFPISSSCRATGRGRRWRAIAATACRLRCRRELHGGLLALARESGASLFMVLQAALAALLTRLGAGSDIPIGSPIAGRTDSALDDLVGFFVNTLVLRTDTSGNPSFRELIARVRATNLAAYGHQDLPFERLVEVLNPARSLSRHPLFQVMLALQNNAPVSFELPGLSARFEPVATASAKFDLSLSLGEQRAADGAPAGIAGVLEYATDLFDRASVEALAARLVRLLEAAVAEPERAIGSLDILARRGARSTILRGWNDTARAIPPATLPELFAAQVGAHARRGRGGVRGAAASATRELDARANQLAHQLRALGVGPEVLVGLCVERSLEMVVGLLGDPQGRRRLSAARSRLSGRAPAHSCWRMRALPVLLTHSALRRAACRSRPACDASWLDAGGHDAASRRRAPSRRARIPSTWPT